MFWLCVTLWFVCGVWATSKINYKEGKKKVMEILGSGTNEKMVNLALVVDAILFTLLGPIAAWSVIKNAK